MHITLNPLKDSLENYRENIASRVEDELQAAETRTLFGLENLLGQFEEHFQTMIKVEEPLMRSLAQEILMVAVRIPGEDGRDAEDLQEVLLEDRMEAFETLLDEEDKLLEKLTREWTSVQHEIILLAVEVLGLDRVNIIPEVDEQLRIVLDKAALMHQKIQDQYEEAREKVARLQNDAINLTTRTLNDATELEKVLLTRTSALGTKLISTTRTTSSKQRRISKDSTNTCMLCSLRPSN